MRLPTCRFHHRFLRRVLLLTLCVVFLELGLRVAGHFYLRALYANNASALKDPHAINIVCLGESSTGGLWLPFQDSYPKQLERRLRAYYGRDDINVVIPIHIGQNSSQMANRIDNYLDLYRPKLILVMAGVNNQWSLAESHVAPYLHLSNLRALPIKAYIFLDQFRTFKLFRWLYLEAAEGANSLIAKQNQQSVLGGIEYSGFPPKEWLIRTAYANRKAFQEAWYADLSRIITAAQKRNVLVYVMTYHIPSDFLATSLYATLARQYSVPIIRNDLSFAVFKRRHTLDQYLLHDHWHPNRLGYEIISNNVFQYIVKSAPPFFGEPKHVSFSE